MKRRSPEAARLEADYLQRLEEVLEKLDATEAAEILQDLKQHIEDELAESESDEISLVQMAQALEHLGPPESITQEALAEAGTENRDRPLWIRSGGRLLGALRRNKWWLAVLVAFLVGNVVLIRYFRDLIEKERVPEGRIIMVGHFPVDKADPKEIHSVEVEFGAAVDPASVDNNSIRLTPHVPGKVKLEDERFLKLELAEPLAYATRYRVDLSENIRGRRREKGPVGHFYFSTPGPSVRFIQQSGIDEGDIYLTFGFNLPVTPEELGRNLVLIYPNDEQAEFEPIGGVASEEIRVRVPKVKFGTIKAVIKPGLKSSVGSLPLEEEQSFSRNIDGVLPAQKRPETVVHTVEVKPTLSFYSMNARYVNGNPVIEVNFNTGIEISSARSRIEVTPEVEITLERFHRGIRILGEFDLTRRYSVRLKKGISAFDAGVLEEDITRAVFFPDMHPEISFAFGGGYLSPEGMVKIPVRSVNISKADLTLWRLYEFNIIEYGLRGGAALRVMPDDVATRIGEKEIEFSGKRNADVETLIDLREFVDGDIRGIYGLEIRSADDYWTYDYAIAVVTDLGISVRLADDKALIWVTSIKNAQPVEGAELQIFSSRRQKLGSGITGPDGVAIIDIAHAAEGEGPALVVASSADDLSYINLTRTLRSRDSAASYGRPYLTKGYEVMAFADRGAYRPQDDVRLSAFIRGTEWSVPEPMPVELSIVKPDGRNLLKRTIMGDQAGRLLAEVHIPYDAMTGRYQAHYAIPGSEERMGTASFLVAEYIPQTLRMKVTAPEDPLYIDKPIEVKAKVEHLFGDPARGLEVKCRVAFENGNASFDQQDWKDYRFGDRRASRTSKTVNLPKKILDDKGEAVFAINVPSMDIPQVLETNIEVEVMEPGGRALTENVRRRIHKWPFYVGVRRPDILNAGEVGEFDLATVKPDGNPYETGERYSAKLFRLTSSYVLRKSSDGGLRYEWMTDRDLVATAEGDLVKGRAQAQITPKHPGRYELAVQVQTGCPVTMEFYVQGEGARWESADPDKLSLTLDREKYRLGDTARLEIRSPFNGTALISLEKDAILKHAIIKVENGRANYEFRIEDDLRPNAYLTATVVRPVGAEKEWMPHRAAGVVRLDIDCEDRKLDLRLVSPESARPGRRFSIEARVTNKGEPRPGAAVVLVAVDEGVLALTNFKTPSPYDFFYGTRRLDIREYDMYSHLAPVLAKWLAESEDKPGGDTSTRSASALGRRLSTIRARRVKTAALYQGALVADENGIVRADFDIPEYVGEMRVMAFAGDAAGFGSSEKALPVKSPLIARASWPRFLAPGDSFKLPVTIYNRTGSDDTIAVDVTFDGPVQTSDTLPVKVSIADGEEKTIHINMRATDVGKAAVRVEARLGDETYGESVEVPVRPAATFARRGSSFKISAGTRQTIEVPGGFLAGTEKNTLTLAGSPVIELSGSLNYLLKYPYGCVEQTTSGLAPLVYLRDLAELTMPGAVGESDVDKLIQASLTRLWRMQTYSGGLSYWPGNKNPSPWGSIYAADILIEARRAGHDVPKGLIEPLLRYLEKKLGSWAKDDKDIGHAAYACYVLARAGRAPLTWIATLEENIRSRREKNLSVPATAVMHLAAAYIVIGETDAAKALAFSAEPSANIRMTGGYLDSPVRELAITLLVMLDADPDGDRIPVLAERLRKKTKLGRWGTTQENAFALMALGKLARRRTVEQSGVMTLTLPDGKSISGDAREGIHLDSIQQGTRVGISFEGRGEVYGFVTGEGVQADGQVKEEDSGITIRRTFLNPKDKSIIDPDALQQGELYIVRLSVQAKERLDNVVILDLLAAGLEIENPQLKGSAQVGVAAGGVQGRRINAEFIERRDDRMIVFCSLQPGNNVFDYVVRAVTPGEYVLAATDASCMYDPDIFSVHGRGTVKVLHEK